MKSKTVICEYQNIHSFLEILGYSHESTKCNLLKERFDKTGIIKYFINIYVVYFNIKNKILTTKDGNPFIIYKFIAGNISLIFESKINLKNLNKVKDNFDINENDILDSVIIGSGPGGSIAALKLLKKGGKVLIIEKGAYFEKDNIQHHSYNQTKLQFSNEGMNFCYGNNPILFAEGSAFGGGSEVNSGLYFKLLGKYKEDFLKLSNISENKWDSKENFVEDKINVQLQPSSYANNIESALIKGSKLNNLICKEIPRWRLYNPEIHQGMTETYLNESESLGLLRLTETKVIKINNNNDKFISLKIIKDEKTYYLKTKKLVLAAGTIGTPYLLKSSNLLKDKARFNLHPMTRCVVDYGKAVNSGDLFPPFQSWTKDLKYKLGYSVSTPPYIKATLASLGASKVTTPDNHMVSYFSSTVLEKSNGRLFFILGKVIPFIYIKKPDRKKIHNGYKILKETLSKGGAKNIWPNKGISPISTVHIFGSIPLNKSKDIDKNGALKDDKRIKISDGSLLPAAPWGNPQAVIMVLNEILMERWINTFGK